MNTQALQAQPVQLEFWFEFASNYSYLSVMRIEAATRKLGISLIWRPFLLGPIFRSQGWNNSPFVLQKAKGDYVWKDMVRQCAKHDLPWVQPSVFPRPSVLPSRVALASADQPWMGDFCRAVMVRNFAHDDDINTPESVHAILQSLGLPADQIMADAVSEENQGKLRAQTQAAMDKGVFGAPTFFVGPEMFWGNDRLEDALAWCATLRAG
jgi:2-hydroxychromene-2-carboxylate isomerase